MEIDFKERVHGKDYKCNGCGGRFKSIGKHPVCPECQSDTVDALS